MVKHLDVLGILFWVWAGMQLLVGLFLVVLYILMGAGMGVAGATGGDEEMMIIGAIFGVGGLVAGLFVIAFSLPAIALGYGLRKRRPWARILGFVVAALALMNIPLGTALGIFAFVVLMDKDVAAELSGRAVPA